jgi:glycosyltransferase involved in cell wall biosynthesis
VVPSVGLPTAGGGRTPPEAHPASGGAALRIDPASPRPAISVVMPVYNGGRFVRRAVESVLTQTFPDWELLAVDDGSTDDSAALLDAAAAADPRVRVFRHPANRGLSAARNTALAAAGGEWVAYLDCDDEFYPDHLARVWDGRGRGDVLVFRYDLVDERPGGGGRVTTYDPEAHLGALVADTLAVPLGVTHRRALTDRVGGFDESLGRYHGVSEDADLWRRFARAGAVFAFVACQSGRYHVRPDSLARTRPPPPDGHSAAVAEPVALRIVPSASAAPTPFGTTVAVSNVASRFGASRPRVMFASYHCYHDPASGAAVCTRDLFAALAARGWRCGAFSGPFLDDPAATPIGATLRDRPGVTSAPGTAGTGQFAVHTVPGPGGFPVTVFAPDPPAPARPPSPEETAGFLAVLAEAMRRFRPDIVLTYGGDPASRGVVEVAKKAGAKVAFWLHNFAYPDAAAFAGCDAVIVPSQFSREYHREALGIDCVALPPVIDVTRVACERPDRGRFVTFVNPVPEKGVFWFARVAEVIGRDRPDIPLLVVEGRGRADWLGRCGVDLRGVPSLHRMANTPDPRAFYRQTRVVVVPSVWRESFGRVAAEAMLNGIPVIASDRGALPEVVGAGGRCLPIPAHVAPDTRTPPSATDVAPWVEALLALWDDAAMYEVAGASARSAAAWHPDAVVPRWEAFLMRLSGRTRASGIGQSHGETGS